MNEAEKARATKLRGVSTEHAALTRHAGLIGWEAVAEATKTIRPPHGKSEAMCRRYADPDDCTAIHLNVAIAIEKAVYATTGQHPVLDWITREINSIDYLPEHTNVCDAALAATAGVGQLAEAVRRARQDNSPGGKHITPSEAETIAKALDMTERKLNEIRHMLASRSNIHPMPSAAE